jgi:hypothetical protein
MDGAGTAGGGRRNRDGALMPRMATLAGADLDAALEAGRISAGEVAAARRRCAGCDWPGECAVWMDAQAGHTLPPAFCRNGALFGALAGGVR